MKLGDEHRSALGLGLSGAHRTGKTTVATRVAEVNECPLILSSGTQVAKDMGIKVDVGMPMELRRDFQEEVLRRFTGVYEQEAGNGLFVTDRTPLDFAAYAMLDWHPAHSTPELDSWLRDYIKRCMEVTGRFFFSVAVVQPGIPYVSGESKPAPNALYQELLNTALIGLGADHRVKSNFFLLPRTVMDNEERAATIAKFHSARLQGYVEFLENTFPLPQ